MQAGNGQAPRTARLRINASAYELLQAQEGGWTQLAVLPRGASALLDTGHCVTEAGLEQAIQAAEDWLMPHAQRLRGEWLEVEDLAGRLRPGLRETLDATGSEWSVVAFEQLFLQLVDRITGRQPPGWALTRAAFIADVVLVRELAHHGQVQGIRLHEDTP